MLYFITYLVQAHISCDSEPLSVGSNGFIITRTNFVTLRYHTDSWGSSNNGFNLVITAFKNSQTFGCADAFQCDAHICISPDLVSCELHILLDDAFLRRFVTAWLTAVMARTRPPPEFALAPVSPRCWGLT